MIAIYMIDDDGGFQVDAPQGSWVFARSRLAAGHVALIETPEGRPHNMALARDALLSGLIAAALGADQ